MNLKKYLQNIEFNNNIENSIYTTIFIEQILALHIRKQDKPFYTEYKIHSFFADGYAPEGFDNFIGPTIFEIKTTHSKLNIKNPLIKEVLKISATNFSDIKNIIFISTQIQSAIKLSEIEYNFFADKNIRIEIWGINELNNIIEKESEVKNIFNNLFTIKLKNTLLKQSNWEEEQENIITQVSEAFQDGQFALILGAGVSCSAGIANWNKLINSLLISFLSKELENIPSISQLDISQISNRLTNIDASSALITARYLRKGLCKGKDTKLDKTFKQEIKNSLYTLRDKKYPKDSNLIKEIVHLCIPKRSGAKIKAVITYNFDDLIEQELKKQGIEFCSICTEDNTHSIEELPIYHVHGFIPEYEEHYNIKNGNAPIFSEEEYHQVYSTPYHWSNLIQLSYFREYTCLFIGLSMTDPNLRRLLEISARQSNSPKHYAFLQRIQLDNFIKDKDIKFIDNEDVAAIYLDMHHKLQEELMKELGISVIWFKSFNDIPKILNKLYQNRYK